MESPIKVFRVRECLMFHKHSKRIKCDKSRKTVVVELMVLLIRFRKPLFASLELCQDHKIAANGSDNLQKVIEEFIS